MSIRRDYDPLWELEWVSKFKIPASLDFSDYKPSSIVLYLHLMREASRQRHSVFKLHTNDVLRATGLHRATLVQARREIERLVRSAETRVKGIWEYEILNPETGTSLPNRENVDFTTVSNEVALEFYRRLMPGNQVAGDLFECPMGVHPSPEFRVILEPGSEKHGCWRCRKCDRHGGFVHAYVMIHKVSRPEANHGVRTLLKTLLDEEQNILANATESADGEEVITL